MTKITFETDGKDHTNMVSIDDILAMIIDKEAENPERAYFDSTKSHDISIMTQVKKYTMDVKEKDFSNLDEFHVESMIEETAINLTDAITKANFDYFKNGMKLGIRMLFELMV